MKTRVKAPTPKHIRLSNSKLNLAHTCKRCYLIREHQTYFTNNREYVAIEIGTALHEAWQDYLVNRDIHKATEVLFDMYPWHLYEKIKEPYSWLTVLRTMNDLIYKHLKYYQVEYYKDKPMIETTFAWELNGWEAPNGVERVTFTGHIDAVVRNHKGDVWAIDFKTTAKRMFAAIGGFKDSLQLIPYGMMVDAIRKGADTYTGDPFYVKYLIAHMSKDESIMEDLNLYKDAGSVRNWAMQVQMCLNELKFAYENEFFPSQPAGHGFGEAPCERLSYIRYHEGMDDLMQNLYGSQKAEAYQQLHDEKEAEPDILLPLYKDNIICPN